MIAAPAARETVRAGDSQTDAVPADTATARWTPPSLTAELEDRRGFMAAPERFLRHLL